MTLPLGTHRAPPADWIEEHRQFNEKNEEHLSIHQIVAGASYEGEFCAYKETNTKSGAISSPAVDVLHEAPALTHFGAHLDAQTVHLIYHGGCPDGCLAAVIMRHAIDEHFKPLSLELIPAAHACRNADTVTEGSTAIFVDISPTVEDIKQLQKCRCVLILDHHPSAADAHKHLHAALPQLSNFSDLTNGTECGATLANMFCASSYIPTWLVHLFHKLDVFDHKLPDDVATHLDAFKGFITQHGVGR